MASRTSIFDRVALRPSQLRTVADRRFADAITLQNTGDNERANGAVYLGGFVVECVLKAAMLEEYPWLANGAKPDRRSKADQHVWSLCYRAHDLYEILEHLPRFRARLHAQHEANGRRSLLNALNAVCGQWTIFARYSPQFAKMSDAKAFLDQVKEIKRWAR